MSQAESQVNLELEEVQSDAEQEPAVDEEQASLHTVSGGDSPPKEPEDSSESKDTRSSKRVDENGLEEFGVEKDPSPNNSRLDNPDGNLESDRRTNTRTSSENTEQEALFPDIENEDQVTLGGEKAYNQCLFE